MKQLFTVMLALAMMPAFNAFAQSNDKAKFQEYEPGYYQNFILKDVRTFEKKTDTRKKREIFYDGPVGFKTSQ